MCKSSALAGWKEEKIFFERVCKTLPRLVGWLFLFPTSQGRAFHTLSKNILFLQPARAEILLTPSENIKFFQPIRREFFKPSQGIFSSFSQPGQKNFSHLQKILNSFGQSRKLLHTLSKNILFLQPVRAEILLTPFQTIFLFFQPARAFTHPLKEYFISPASQGRKMIWWCFLEG